VRTDIRNHRALIGRVPPVSSGVHTLFGRTAALVDNPCISYGSAGPASNCAERVAHVELISLPHNGVT
jgi:hypothetical protein